MGDRLLLLCWFLSDLTLFQLVFLVSESTEVQKGGESLLAHVLGDCGRSLEVIRVEVMELAKVVG